MLEHAVRGQVPFITVSCADEVNFPRLLMSRLGKKPVKWTGDLPQFKGHKVFYTTDPKLKKVIRETFGEILEALRKLEFTLIVLAGDDVQFPEAFHCGDLAPNNELVGSVLSNHVGPAMVAQLTPYAKSLTLTQTDNLCRFLKYQGEITVMEFARARMKVGGFAGLDLIVPDMSTYTPDPALVNWAKVTLPFVIESPDPRLRTRGILFDGVEGTGKTMACKYLADRLNLPLYRVQTEGILTKWHGETERNFSQVLDRVDSLSPCVVMFDEVEKFLRADETDHNGTIARLLAVFLWWLQERKSATLAVMTTNDRSRLPPELIRPRRIDAILTLEALDLDTYDTTALITKMVNNYTVDDDVKAFALDRLTTKIIQQMDGERPFGDYVTQAKLENEVIKGMKIKLVQKQG